MEETDLDLAARVEAARLAQQAYEEDLARTYGGNANSERNIPDPPPVAAQVGATSVEWQTVKEATVKAFSGEHPRPQAEESCARAFELNPTGFMQAVNAVAAKLSSGEIRSGWAILRFEADKLRERTTRNPTANLAANRETYRARGAQWMHNAGMHFDSEGELTDELFGDRGMLRSFPDLQAEMLALWNELRPQGIAVEQAEIQRALKWRATRALAASAMDGSDAPVAA